MMLLSDFYLATNELSNATVDCTTPQQAGQACLVLIESSSTSRTPHGESLAAAASQMSTDNWDVGSVECIERIVGIDGAKRGGSPRISRGELTA